MKHTEGDWKYGFNPGVTGPTAASTYPFCGGREWPYRTITVGTETIALIPAQDLNRQVGQGGSATIEEMEANAHLIAAAPDMYEALKRAKETIHIWHGNLAWEVYQQSPEMIAINEALSKAEQVT